MSRKRVIDPEALYADYELVEALGERGLHLYVALWSYAEDWGGYTPDYNKIALKLGWLRFTPQEVKEYIDKLISIGKVVVYTSNGDGPMKTLHWIKNLMYHQGAHEYRPLPKLPLPPWIVYEKGRYPAGRKYATYRIDGITLENFQNCREISLHELATPALVGSCSQEKPEPEPRKVSNRFNRRSKGQIPPYSPEFEAFYKAFPRKQGGKEKAWEHWERRRKGGSLPSIDELMGRLQLLKGSSEWQEENGRWIPFITTFLNQGRWTDADDLIEKGEVVRFPPDPKCPECEGKGLKLVEREGNIVGMRCGCTKKWRPEG